jgi:undecaprenyl-diphosphatase
LRPCNDTSINEIIRVVKGSNSYSFFSGHAANTSAVALFLFLNFRKKYKYFGLIFIWPMIFAYSRIYLGLHFPIDILTGYFFGTTFGLLMFKIYRKIIVS